MRRENSIARVYIFVRAGYVDAFMLRRALVLCVVGQKGKHGTRMPWQLCCCRARTRVLLERIISSPFPIMTATMSVHGTEVYFARTMCVQALK